MKRTDRKKQINQRRYDVQKLSNRQHIEKFKLELRNRFAVLEHQEEQMEDLEAIWGQFKTVFTQTAENTLGAKDKRR